MVTTSADVMLSYVADDIEFTKYIAGENVKFQFLKTNTHLFYQNDSDI